MDDRLINEAEQQELTDKDIFVNIWLSPRMVFKYINDKQYDKYLVILLILAGISRAFDRAVAKNMGDDTSLGLIIVTCIIGGAAFGWISFYIYAFLVSWTGKWLKGDGGTRSVLRVLAYAAIPSIFALILLFLQIGVFGEDVFKEDGDLMKAGALGLGFSLFCLLLELVLLVWSFVLAVVGVSEVQKMSIGKSIVNLLLPGALIISTIFVVVLIVYVLTALLN